MSPTPVCLITGSATGIGAACALAFAQQGWQVSITLFDDSQREEATRVASDCAAVGPAPWIETLDVRDDAECKRFAAAAVARFGRIDALINCAGTTRFIPHAQLDALDGDEFRRTYDVNVVGMYQMTRACAPALTASGAGSVVNISSIGGVIGRGSSVAYAASKGAVNTMTLALARALAPHIRVNAIAPGMVVGGLPSRVLAPQQHDEVVAIQAQASVLKRASQPAEVAALAWFLCTGAPGITGAVIPMDNGLHLNAG